MKKITSLLSSARMRLVAMVGLALMVATAVAVPAMATEPEHVIDASAVGNEAKAEFVYILGGILIVIIAVVLGNLAVKTIRKHVK